MEQMSPKLQQKNASFLVGMELQWQPKNATFSVDQKHQIWEKKFENKTSRRDKGTSSGFDEKCKEFGRMFCEKLQEFAMILSKEYHYSFPAEYFDDYHGSFNKEEFLKMEQLKEKFRRQEVDSLPTSNMEWKKYIGLGGMDEKGDDNDNAGSNSRLCGGSVQGVWAKGELKEHIDSFGKEVLDGDVFGIRQQEQSNFKEEGEEEEEEKSEEKRLEDDTQSIDSLSSTLTSAETLGQVSIIEQSLAGSEVAASPNVNAHKQPWYENSRKEYKPPLLHFEAAVDSSKTWLWVEWG